MHLELFFRLIGAILLLGSNAFFVVTEFSLTRLRQYEPDEMKADDGLATAWQMTKKLEIYLTGCQVGITFSSVLLGIVAEPALTQLFEPLLKFIGLSSSFTVGFSIVLGIIVINLMHMIWAEQTPTYLGIEKAKTIAKYCAPIHYYWTIIAYPFIYIGDKVTKATLRIFGITMQRSWTESNKDEESARSTLKEELTDLLKGEDVSSDRREEVVNALSIDDIPVADIMIPERDIIFLSEQKSFSENLDRIHSGKSRFPLAGNTNQDFKGVVFASEMLANIQDLLSGTKKIGDLCREGMTVPHTLRVSKLIDQFQREHHELALVTNNNTIVGLVTITDALEAIVGNVEDPMDMESGRNSRDEAS